MSAGIATVVSVSAIKNAIANAVYTAKTIRALVEAITVTVTVLTADAMELVRLQINKDYEE